MKLFGKTTEQIDTWTQSHALTRMLTSHVWLAFFYGIFLFLYEIVILREVVPVVHPLLIAWAGALIFYDIVVRKYWKEMPYWKVLAVFAVICLVSAFMNREGGIAGNIKSFIMVMLPLGAFYPICLMEKKENRERAFLRALLGGAIVVFIASFIALVLFLVRFRQEFTFRGVAGVIGYRYYLPKDPTSGLLLYGIYKDTNHAAIYALVFAVYSLFGMIMCRRGEFGKKWQNKWGGVFFACNFVVQMLYFPLANSRGGWLSLIFSMAVVLFLFFARRKLSKGQPVVRCVAGLLLAASCTALVCGVMLVGRTAMSHASVEISENVGTEISGAIKLPGKKPPLKDDSFVKKDSFEGAGRIDIWKQTLQLVACRPLWGIGPNHTYFAEKYDLASYTIGAGKAVHNSYLHLMLNDGIPAFAVMLLFCLLCCIQVGRACWKRGKKLPVPFYMVTVMAALVACGAMFLSCIFTDTTAMYFLLLSSMGYLMAVCREVNVKGKKVPIEDNSLKQEGEE